MEARDKFRPGQFLKPSAEGLAHFAQHSTIGPQREKLRVTVVGFSADPDCVLVQRSMLFKTESYAAKFWEAA